MTNVFETRWVRVRSIHWHNDSVKSYELVSHDGTALAPFTAGSHINVRVPGGWRSYSLANSPLESHRYVLGIARESGGRGGSKHLHDTVRVGDLLEVSVPRNLFPLHDGNAPAVLIAGGIGITPMLSMAAQCQARKRPWSLIYAVRNAQARSFDQEIQAWPEHVTVHLDDVQQQMLDIEVIVSRAEPSSHFYCCGPAPMLKAFLAATAHLPHAQVHYEQFATDEQPDVAGTGFEVCLARTGKTVRVGDGVTILQALTDAGMAVTSACGQGVCGACETRVLSGLPDHRDSLLTESERAANDTILICCSRALTESLTLDL